MVKDTSGKEVECERKDLSGKNGIKIVCLAQAYNIEIGASYTSMHSWIRVTKKWQRMPSNGKTWTTVV